MRTKENDFWDELNKEQEKIINAKDNLILVSAGPGSGKTYTLVHKISKDLAVLDKYHGIIACSFTNQASKQLKNKIEQLCDIKSSFIGTIDSFVLSEIINPYKNRLLKHLHINSHIDKLKIVMPQINSQSAFLTKVGNNVNYAKDITNYKNNWLTNFANSEYEISFPSYLFCEQMIREMKLVKDYIINRYNCIYVDEAQDLNDFQIDFIKCLINECKINVVLIGDKNQSIYQFRGAKPEKFYSFTNSGFVEYKIIHSVRCDKSILDFANKYIDNKYIIDKKNSNICVKKSAWPTDDFFTSTNYTYMVLFENNIDTEKCFDYLIKKNIDVVLAKPITVSDKEFKDNYFNILEETLRFFYNYDNGKYTYSIDDYKEFVSDFLSPKAINRIKNISSFENGIDFFSFVIELNGEIVDKKVLKDLSLQLTDKKVLNYYRNSEGKNKIMTIHASKGLEADKVVLVLNKLPFNYDLEYKRKLYVAFTRAKDELLIVLTGNCKKSELDNEIYSLINNCI